LPPDPGIERPTYTVQQGEITRALEVTARAMPVDQSRIAFKRDGRVDTVRVNTGDAVRTGDLIAELQQDEALDEVAAAEDAVAQAQRDLENAQVMRAREIRAAELDLTAAREALARLLPGGEADVVKVAVDAVDAAQEALDKTRIDTSLAKVSAEVGLETSAEALVDAQEAFSTASWNWDWVERYGTDPVTPTIINEEGIEVPNRLNDRQRKTYERALVTAQRGLEAAERNVETARRALDDAREAEIEGIAEAEEKLATAQRTREKIGDGSGSREVREARLAIDRIQATLTELRSRTLNEQLKRIEEAGRNLERAQRKLEEGRLLAPQDGTVLALAIEPGMTVTAFEAVVEVADVRKLEFGATLGAEQMRQLAEGQPAEGRLLSRPDLAIPLVIRRLPPPYGSGSSGAVQDPDQTTRFEIQGEPDVAIEAGSTVVRVSIILERKEGVLWLPPEAIRQFERGRFVIVRDGDRDRRQPVKLGIETDGRVEILEGVVEGDIVVGE
jgi:multidrug efflux pump subunit AcrA (membrane-fusion protein)